MTAADLTSALGTTAPTLTRSTIRQASARRRSKGSLAGRHTSGAARVAVTTILVMLAVVLCAVVTGAVFGYRALTIQSGSMTPTLHVGDVVIDRSVQPLSVRPHEIVTFRDPHLGQELVTHRVISMRRSGDRVDFVTKGDANVVTEHWDVAVTVASDSEILVLPRIGEILADISLPVGASCHVGAGRAVAGSRGTRWIWRDPPDATLGRPAADR